MDGGKPLRWSLAAVALLLAGGMAVAAAAAPSQDRSDASSVRKLAPAKKAKAASSRQAAGRGTGTKQARGAKASTGQKRAQAARAAVPAVALPVAGHDAEARLLDIVRLVEQQKLDEALKAAERLTADVPNFHAAQLVYGDLLRFRSGRIARLPVRDEPGVLLKVHLPGHPLGPADEGAAQAWLEQLQGLREQIVLRVQGATVRPPAGSLPREFLALEPSVRHAIAVDASRSRLYLFEQRKGRLELVKDFYVSIGKLGIGKAEEGDQRTPEGIYFIGRHIPGQRLPKLYGKGALTLNYPNAWDRAVGRTGSGIWLHGVPPEEFARLPRASDGCIVLANPDLLHLARVVDSQTPVLVRERLDWADMADTQRRRAAEAFRGVLSEWQRSWAGTDAAARARLYSGELAAVGTSRAPQKRLDALFRQGDAAVQDVSVFAWQDAQGEIRIVDLTVKRRAEGEALPLRQYWRRAGDRWLLFSEEVRG